MRPICHHKYLTFTKAFTGDYFSHTPQHRIIFLETSENRAFADFWSEKEKCWHSSWLFCVVSCLLVRIWTGNACSLPCFLPCLHKVKKKKKVVRSYGVVQHCRPQLSLFEQTLRIHKHNGPQMLTESSFRWWKCAIVTSECLKQVSVTIIQAKNLRMASMTEWMNGWLFKVQRDECEII